MKHSKIILLLLCLQTALTASTTFYVKPNGTGSGTDWKNATGELSAVLFAAQAGDQIFIAAGIYYPTLDARREVAFVVSSGIKIYGGFAGYESSPEEREISKNLTVLSGEINELDAKDNSQTIVHLKPATSKILLDGLIIQNGYADSTAPSPHPSRGGGAVYIEGSRHLQTETVIFRNCIFQKNQARDGGAVYVQAGAGAIFENCLFKENLADFDGGAIYVERRLRQESLLSFVNCQFIENKATYGGAVCTYSGGDCDLFFMKCSFLQNEAHTRGHSIYEIAAFGHCETELNACQFIEEQEKTPLSYPTKSTVKKEEKEWSN